MYITCLDMEGVLVPEIWIEFARESGIPELTRTTRDEPNYDKRSETQAIILSDTFEEFAQPLMKKLGWPTIFCNSLEVDADGFISGIKMRCEHSKLTTVRGLQSIGFETIASGDSYNDLEMIEASKAGFLFRTTEKIKHDYPHLPAFEGYDELLAAIEQVIHA